MSSFAPGDRVQQQYRKYDGRPHWQFDTVYLGEDDFGTWVGGAAGDAFERPDRHFVSPVDWVTLIPRADWFVATFNQPGSPALAHTYIDLMSIAEWDRNTVRAIDLDLDVIRLHEGPIYLDDEDEFEEHRVAFGYPQDLVDTVRATADRLLREVIAGAEPYGTVHAAWQARWERLRERDPRTP